jgi:hypothetical protein
MMDGLTPNLTKAYLKQVDRQRATFLLDLARVILAPHMSDSSRREVLDALQRRVTGEEDRVVTISSNEDFQKYISSLASR